jgi:hypothetical protein
MWEPVWANPVAGVAVTPAAAARTVNGTVADSPLVWPVTTIVCAPAARADGIAKVNATAPVLDAVKVPKVSGVECRTATTFSAGAKPVPLSVVDSPLTTVVFDNAAVTAAGLADAELEVAVTDGVGVGVTVVTVGVGVRAGAMAADVESSAGATAVNRATKECDPDVKVDTVSVAMPPVTGADPSAVEPSVKATVPAEAGATDAVSVTGSPAPAVPAGLTVKVVDVLTG